MWLMKTLLTSRCINQRGAGQLVESLALRIVRTLIKSCAVIPVFLILNCFNVDTRLTHSDGRSTLNQ
ncbi:hypothetical protein CI629_18520 [Klebsiella pneumoniae subsp. pneumoniae]|nr:hypothetical protein CI627_20940 [Klebsiella pneumoniae subsp. pneumoniae]OYE84820.1 hypothetical protein CI629_18520 [Klebsiella pneumoniae subsp. pneumoniae]OYE88371.1 hypothetical protein CI628_28385 [Klebsiella pneumoniae subsp. pneumoniae]